MHENPQTPVPGKWKRYPSYKQSGVEWLGEVPERWGIGRLKNSIDTIKNGIWGEEPDGINDIICIRVADFDRVKLRLLRHEYTLRAIEKSDRDGRILENGDLLLEKSGGGENQPVGIVIYYSLDRDAVCSNFVSKLVVNCSNNSRYITYLFAHLYSRLVNTRSIKQTTGIQNLDINSYFNERVCYPSTPEQTAIATFLDRETARIDALIEKKERLIALLEEKRAALISHAVTKGLNPDAKMKDSGVEWLGRVPEKWRVMRIAMAVQKITNGFVGPTRDILVDDGIRYLQSLHIKNGKILFNKPYYVSEPWSLGHPKSILKEGDVLIVQTGDVGQCCTVTKEFENCNCHALIILRLKDGYGSGYFLSSLLRSDYGKNILNSIQEGALHPHLECGKVREVPVLLPHPKEQEKIMEYLEKKISIIDDMITRITKSIDILQEYRSALISSAVTGKIDVRQDVTA